MLYLSKLINSYDLEFKIFTIVLATLFISFIVRKVLNYLLNKARKTSHLWDNALLISLIKPVKVTIYLLGALIVLSILGYDLEIKKVQTIINIAIIFITCSFVLKLSTQIEKLYLRKKSVNSKEQIHTINIITKLIKASVIITTILILMHNLGLNVGGLLAFGGMGGIAVGFAAKDLLANFFGAIMIFLDKPFKIGDWIKSPDREIEGVVDQIGWRLTKIITFAKRPIYVPNSIFTTIVVENPSRMSHRRIYEKINIYYKDFQQLNIIADAVQEYFDNSDLIDNDEVSFVNFNDFAKSSLEVAVYCHIYETEWKEFQKIKHKILFDIGDIIRKNKARFSLPAMLLEDLAK